MITCAARDRIVGLIDRGVSEGATLVVDGRKPVVPGHERGFFVGPTLFDHATDQMSIYREEIFGPVLTIVRVQSLDAAIALINANPYANGAALFTRSGFASRRFQQDVEVGMIGINVPIPVPMAFYSFGGWRIRCSGICTCTAWTACASTHAARQSRRAGPMTAALLRDFICLHSADSHLDQRAAVATDHSFPRCFTAGWPMLKTNSRITQ